MSLDMESMESDADECDATTGAAEHGADHPAALEKPRGTPAAGSIQRLGLITGFLIVAVMAGLVGWFGFRYSQLHRDQHDRELFLQIGRQAALNLTTISYTHVDADVQRILDSSTGAFHDDFRNRSQPFMDVVKQSQSTTEGSITEAGLESVSGETAQVLVTVAVTMSNGGVAQQEPRAWRMRIDVQKIDEGGKVSNVQFVP